MKSSSFIAAHRGRLLLAMVAMLASAATAIAVAPGEFRFRENGWQSYVEAPETPAPDGWIPLARKGSTSPLRWFSSATLLVKPQSGVSLADLVGPSAAHPPERLERGWWKLETTSPREALVLAEWLSHNDAVLFVQPNMRRPVRPHGPYAAAPNDRFFTNSIHLENRASNGTPAGIDLNIREAWSRTRGAGVTVGVVDDGVQLDHPDLVGNTVGRPHYNFYNSNSNAFPQFASDTHGTGIAGLIAAVGGNNRGVVGTAPEAGLSSMRIFSNGFFPPDDLALVNAFTFSNDTVWVQNHSWGYTGNELLLPGQMILDSITNAVLGGRSGRGTIMVRSAGNDRKNLVYTSWGDANNDGYKISPMTICVAAVRQNGRFANYSSPGANILLSAVSGESPDPANLIEGSPKLPTTDLTGTNGLNANASSDDSWDYAFGSTGLAGTSASAPQIAGVAALMLSVNTNLTWRDVQQILVLSSRQGAFDDPALMTNGAGLVVSRNTGYGVPDAGRAVDLALAWSNRPPAAASVTVSNVNIPIPDDGLRLHAVVSPGVLLWTGGTPSLGAQADGPTATVPLVNVGKALTPLTTNLTGKAALIERGQSNFEEKFRFAADAGAVFAVLYNGEGTTTERQPLGGTEYTRIPAISISRTDGLELVDILSTNALSVQLAPTNASVTFPVSASLICEHVQVRIQTSHPRRGDLRITLRSPSGTLSVLQSRNEDNTAGPVDWTYLSTQHFFEPTKGNWTLAVTDQTPGSEGYLESATLTLHGVALVDTDGDGLQDDWEMQWFGNLSQAGRDDPDGDGENNLIEQARRTDPTQPNRPWKLDLSRWSATLGRLSWPGNGLSNVLVDSSTVLPTFTNFTNVPSRFPTTELFVPMTNVPGRFFRVRPTVP